MTTQETTWKDKFSFLQNAEGIKHTVGGEKIEFLAVSTGVLLKLKNVVEPIAQAVAMIFDKQQNDQGTIQRTFGGTEDEPAGSEIIVEATSEKTLALRLSTRTKAINNLMSALVRDTNIEAVGDVILDSMRKHFGDVPGQPSNKPPAKEFMETIPADALVEMIVGVAKANKGVFGPLGLETGQWSKLVQAAVDAKLNEVSPDTETPKADDEQTSAPAPGSIPLPTPAVPPVGQTS